jgi:hypothetical protein
MFRGVWLIAVALIPGFVGNVSAQRSHPPNPDAVRSTINDETFRELMNRERESRYPGRDNSDETRALLKQMVDDFRTLQSINNKMMADVFAKEAIDYDGTSAAIAQINTRATRLKNNLALPVLKDAKKKDVTASGTKEFKSALLVMDRSIMSFVNNQIFQQPNVMQLETATRASQDLADVIAFSATLKKIADNLKSSSTKP